MPHQPVIVRLGLGLSKVGKPHAVVGERGVILGRELNRHQAALMQKPPENVAALGVIVTSSADSVPTAVPTSTTRRSGLR